MSRIKEVGTEFKVAIKRKIHIKINILLGLSLLLNPGSIQAGGYNFESREDEAYVNQALEDAKAEALTDTVTDRSDRREIETKAAELNNFDPVRLDSQGLASEEANIMQDIDYSEHDQKKHIEDMKPVFEASKDIIQNSMKALNMEGFDCTQIPGNREELDNPWKIVTRTVRKKDLEIKKVTCEDLRNTYTCKDTLKLSCAEPSTSKLEVTSSTINYSEEDGVLVLGGSFNSGSNLSGRVSIFGIVESSFLQNLFHKGATLEGGREGSTFDYEFNFNIGNPALLNSFTLKSLDYKDFVLITLNDQLVYSGPYGGDRLYRDYNHLRKICIGTESYYLFWEEDITIKVPGVCTGKFYYDPDGKVIRHSDPDKNLIPYLKSGSNKMSIRIVVGGSGGTLINIEHKMNTCTKWNESWSESCILN